MRSLLISANATTTRAVTSTRSISIGMRRAALLIVMSMSMSMSVGVVFVASPKIALAHDPLGQQLDDLTDAIAHTADNANLLSRRAIAHAELGEMHEALADIEAAIHTEPRCDFYMIAGEFASLMGDFEAARDYAMNATAMEPYNARALWILAVAYAELGADVDAYSSFRSAVVADPQPDIVLHFARFLVSRDDVETAILLLGDMRALRPSAALDVMLYETLMEVGRFDEAAGLANEAPDSSVRWALREGLALQAAGDDGAPVAFEAALVTAEANVQRRGSCSAYADRARIRIALGDFVGGRADAELANTRCGHDPEIAALWSELDGVDDGSVVGGSVVGGSVVTPTLWHSVSP